MTAPPITDFDGLLLAAKLQPTPQRLLFVFLQTVTQKDYTAEQRQGFEAGIGGALQPQFCVDLAPTDIVDLKSLVAEADQQGAKWDKMLIASMDAPTHVGAKITIDEALKEIVARVQNGADLTPYLCFSRDGEPILFD